MKRAHLKGCFSDIQLSWLSNYIGIQTGLKFPENRWDCLERQLVAALQELGFTDPGLFVQHLAAAPLTHKELEILVEHLTNNETYFWREPRAFEALVKDIVPELERQSHARPRQLRIWSAGCSSGEEPYSIAIALCEMMSKPADWNITILATDFNRRVLRKAATGMYGAWSFRNPPPWLMKYFRRKDNHLFEIIPEIRRMVTFSYLNLVTDVYPPAMNDGQAIHVIFCRNVLMYLSPEHIKKIGQQFFASLCNDGWLITSGSELLPHLFSPLVPVNLRGTVLFRKPLTAAPPKKMVLELLQVNMPPTFISQAPIGFSKPHQGDQEQPVSPSKHVPVGTKDEERNAVFSLANQGRLSEAILLCESSLLRDKLNHYLHFLHAKILLEQNKEQEALSSLRRVIYLDPGFVLGHFTMGNLFRRQGNSRKAEKSYANVIDLLSTLRNDALLDESEGLTAGRLREIIQETSQPGYSP